jgi:PAS domain S-box-containing protein
MGALKTQRSEWAIESAVQGIISLDTRGLVVDWNPSARRIFGYPASVARGRPLHDLFPTLARRLGRMLSDARKTETGYAEASIRRSDGKEANVAFIAVRTAKPKGLLVIVRDIS